VLQEANVPIISDTTCNAPDYYDNQITTSMFCAGFEKGGTDACQVSGVFTHPHTHACTHARTRTHVHTYELWLCVMDQFPHIVSVAY